MPLNKHARRCTATTRDGDRCKNPAVDGSAVCRMHGAGGGAPRGNKNAVTHGGYALKDMPPTVRQAYMLKRQNELDDALDEALENGNRWRANRILDLLTTNELLLTREAGRLRRSL